jgi:hypothetical protein
MQGLEWPGSTPETAKRDHAKAYWSERLDALASALAACAR